MKARTKLQKRVMEAHCKLPDLTENQKRWAIENCHGEDAYLTKDEIWCLHCGEIFKSDVSQLSVDIIGHETICPNCGRKLKVTTSRKKKFEENWYYTILTTFKGFQVCRNFIVSTYRKRGERDRYVSIDEAVQNWIDEDGNETIVARPCNQNIMVYDDWNFSKPMSIKTNRTSYDSSMDKYEIDSKFIYPTRHVLPKIRRNGYTGRFTGISCSELFKLLLTNNKAEMLIKTKQFDLLRHMHVKYIPDNRWHSINICNRNRYIVKDASIWMDYMDLLDYFHLDTHNAKYVCPSNVKHEHDRLLRKKKIIEERKEAEKKRKEARKWENLYKKEKGKFFGICFVGNGIEVSVITSVADIAEEGIKMHHCVYDMEYYKKPNSLILSARDMHGNRIETVEVSLTTFKVVQSKGVFNSKTPYHDQIIELVNKNMKLIMERMAS